MEKTIQDQREENYYNGKDFLFLGVYHIKEHAYNEYPDKQSRIVTYSVFKPDNPREYSFTFIMKLTLYKSGKMTYHHIQEMTIDEEVIFDMIEKICQTIKHFKG